MPIIFTFDLDTDSLADGNDRARIRVAFQRLGWASVGGTAYRYPAMDSDHVSEDWLNHVVPALMYFRSIVVKKGITVTKFSLDAASSAGYKPAPSGGPAIGAPVQDASLIEMYAPSSAEEKLSEQVLQEWIKACGNVIVDK